MKQHHFAVAPPLAPPSDRGARSLAFHQSMPGYAPTRLLASAELASAAGVATVLVKDERLRFGLPSFKILGASFALACVCSPGPRLLDFPELAAGAARGKTFVTASEGNHGQAVAWLAREWGARAEIFLSRAAAAARAPDFQAQGATVEVVDGTYDDAMERAYERARSTGAVFAADTDLDSSASAFAAQISAGYETMWDECDMALAGKPPPDVLVVQAGVGALAASAARYVARRWPGTRLLVVEAEGAACLLESARAQRAISLPGPFDSRCRGLNCGRPSSLALREILRSAAAFVEVEDVEVLAAEALGARLDLAAGPSAWAGYAGFSALARSGLSSWMGPDTRALVVLTEARRPA